MCNLGYARNIQAVYLGTVVAKQFYEEKKVSFIEVLVEIHNLMEANIPIHLENKSTMTATIKGKQ